MPVLVMPSVGEMYETVTPGTVPMPMPQVTQPVAFWSRRLLKAYPARRAMALPAMTFSPIACLSKEAMVPGAMIGTFPDATSSALTMPLTPP